MLPQGAVWEPVPVPVGETKMSTAEAVVRRRVVRRAVVVAIVAGAAAAWCFLGLRESQWGIDEGSK